MSMKKLLMAMVFMVAACAVFAKGQGEGQWAADERAVYDGESEALFSYTGPEGISARVYRNGNFAGSLMPGETKRLVIADGSHTFEVHSGEYDAANKKTVEGAHSARLTINAGGNRTTALITIAQADGQNRVTELRVQDTAAIRTQPKPEEDTASGLWYGADLSDFPPEVVEWIKTKGFPKEKMETRWSVDPRLKVWWSEDGNAVLCEASYTVAPGYANVGSVTTWGTGAKYGGAKIGAEYGEYAKYRTLKFRWEHKRESERLYRTDPAYRAVIDAAKKICAETEYDWANFSGYRGAAVKRTPGMTYAVCDGYADTAMERLLAIEYVKTVEKWSLPGIHAWNNVLFKDGRRLYVDVTWFDNEHINHETGRIYETDDYDWEEITFNKDLFDHSNVGYGSRTFVHAAPQVKIVRSVSK